ncbi:MAG: ParA family protein [Rhodothermales bacterium]|nr:ParA family protein [Rhodothermales bacterium]
MPMIPITVANHKGGTGKTTSTMMIAAALGMSGRRVLVVDLDPQGFLTRMMGVAEPDPRGSSCALFDESQTFDPASIVNPGAFHLMPASTRLSTDMRRLTRSIDVLWVREFQQAHFGEYDYVLYDSAAALTVFTLNALAAARHILIPVLPEYQPVVGAEQTYQTAITVGKKLNPDMKEPLMLLTMVDGRKRNHIAYEKYLRERYEDRVLESRVRTSASLSTTRHDGKTAFDFDPRGRGAQDYAAVVDELVAKTAEPVLESEAAS